MTCILHEVFNLNKKFRFYESLKFTRVHASKVDSKMSAPETQCHNVNSPSDIIKEGKAEILQPPDTKIFYNPVQEFNRDLSTLTLQVFSKQFLKESENKSKNKSTNEFRILEALSASGLRSIRYAKEIENVTQVVANDISQLAVKNIEKNLKHNKVEDKVITSHSDAVAYMFSHIDPPKRFQAVDLDPYGSPTPFLDACVQCVVDGGILLVTCTDLAILCGNFPETCYVKYGSIPLRCNAKHEMAIRIVLQNIQSHASRYKRYIVPLLSVSADFYIRVFVKIYTSAAACKFVTSKLAMFYRCTGCDSVTFQPLGVTKKGKDGKNFVHSLPQAPHVGMKCSHCGGNHQLGGPLWTDAIHDRNFVGELLKSKSINEFGTSKRLIGMLSVIQEELDIPFYLNTTKLSSLLKCTTIPLIKIRSAILNGNYQVSDSHASKQSIKTNAPMKFIWDIMKEWVRINCKKVTLEPGCPGGNILRLPVENKIDFSIREEAMPLSKEMGLMRYQQNPMPYWGPGSKSRTHVLVENPKKVRNQSRKKKLVSANKNKVPKLDDLNENVT